MPDFFGCPAGKLFYPWLLVPSGVQCSRTCIEAIAVYSTDEQALKNLRTLLTRLRQALPDADRCLDITTLTLQWRPDAPLTLDVAEFEAAVARAASAQAGDDAAAVEGELAAAAAINGL